MVRRAGPTLKDPSPMPLPLSSEALRVGPLKEGAFTSRLHSERVASWLGLLLGVTFTLCMLTGLWSHFVQHPPSWFTVPAHPSWLYRVTQGVHITTGLAAVPLLLAKLFTVYPQLFAWPPLKNLRHATERGVLLLVGGSLLQLATGVMNIFQWYAFGFFFTTVHYWSAWVVIGALTVHVGSKIAVALPDRACGRCRDAGDRDHARSRPTAGPSASMNGSIRAVVTTLLLSVALAACGSNGSGGKAAEPAKAPPVTVAPAGKLVAVGHEAEGVVIDPVSHLAAVGVRAPSGLALVATGAGALLSTVPLSGHVRHLALLGQDVLVPVEDAGALVRVHLPDGTVTSRVTTGDYPHGVTAVGSDAVAVANEHGHRISLVRNGSVVATAAGFKQPGGLATTSEGVYVIDVAASTLTRLGPQDLHREGQVAAGNGPTHVLADRRGNLVVADTRGVALLVFSPTLKLLRRVPLAGTPYGLAYDTTRDELWVTLTSRNEVVGLQGLQLTEVRRFASVRQPNTIAVDPVTGTVAVASRSDGVLQIVSR